MIHAAGFFAFVGLLMLPALSLAEETQTVVVTSKPETGPEGIAPTTFATVIETTEHAAEIETVTEALAESVGVQVRRYGGLGAFSTVSIRGTASNQVQIYLDGIPLSRAQNESVNLADLPIDSLDRIEVYRGVVPVTFGVAGPGGVVNLITKRPSVEPTAELSAAYGSFDTRKLVASYSQTVRGIEVLAHATYLGSEGDFSFKPDDPVAYPDVDKRINNEFNSVDTLLKASYSPDSRTDIELTSEGFYKDQGVPGPAESKQAEHVSFEEWRSFNYLRLNRRHFLTEALDTSAAVFGAYQVQRLRDVKGESGLSNQDRNDETVTAGGNGTATLAVSPGHTGTMFTELAHETFAPYNKRQDKRGGPDQNRLRWTLAFQDEAWLLPDTILVLPSVRYEHLEDDGSDSFSPAGMPAGNVTVGRDLWGGAIGVQVKPFSWFTIKSNIGRYQRAPSFFELFGTGAGVVGNPDLDPETAKNRDVGFILTGDMLPPWVNARAEYAYFDNEIDDLITLVASSNTIFARAQNIGGARIRGHELVQRIELLDHIGFDLNYTHQNARDRSEDTTYRGKPLPFRPSDELYSRFELYGALGKLYYEFNFIGDNCVKRACFSGDRVDDRSIHTAGVAFNAADWLTLRFEGRNLSDNQIRDVANFPLPGRSAFSSVTAHF